MSSVPSRQSSRTAQPDSRFRIPILVCVVALLSFLTAKLGGMLVLRPQMLWPLWPGCAFLVAVLLLVPRRIWPILIAAGLAGFVLYDVEAGLTLRSISLLVLADAVEILIASLGVSYAFDGPPPLNSVRSLAKYSFFAVILAPLSAAFISTTAFGGDYWIRWRIGFFTEALALLTLTPAILNWASQRQAWMQKSRSLYFEAATLIAGLTLFCYLTFAVPGRSSQTALLYSLLPFLLWSALRFGSLGISTSMIVVAFLSIWGAVHGRGPFTGADPLYNVLSIQLFLFFAATPFMVLAALAEEHKRTERGLRESEKRFRLVADTAPALIWMSDIDKLCNYFNKPWLDFTGRSMESELGNGWAEGVHPEDLQRCMETYTQAFDRREEFRMEYRLRRHDREYRWVLDIGVPRFNQDRCFVGYVGCGIDVSERKLAGEALRESEDKLRLLLDSTAEAIYGIDLEHRCTFCNPACLRTLGYERMDDVLGKNMHELMHHHRADGSLFPIEECRVHRVARTGEGIHAEDEVLWRANGTSFPAEYWSYPQRRGQEIVGAVVAFLNITERKLAEAALANVSRKLIEAQEHERTRIARELHDDIGQRLAMLAIELEKLQKDSSGSSTDVSRSLSELWKQTSEIATDVQSLSHELHSSKLHYLGLTAAIRSFCKEFGEQQKVEIDFTSHDLPGTQSPDISLCLFRVLQEGLHNSVKHSGVRFIQVRFWGTPDELHLTVSDQGRGFDRLTVEASQGLGLISMEERLKLVNGTFSIDSDPQRGTSIHARVPLSSEIESVRAAG
jgi:PAS domain S-box-containing protein